MAIVRMIYISVPEGQAERAKKNWKSFCAPLMIRQPGCISEELLHCTDDPSEFISYSEWENESSIQSYLESGDHQEIKRQNSNISGARVTVKHYQLVS